MRESLRYLAKSKSEEQGMRTDAVNHRIAMTEKFVAARQLVATDGQRAMDLCGEILFGIPVQSQVGGAVHAVHGEETACAMVHIWDAGPVGSCTGESSTYSACSTWAGGA